MTSIASSLARALPKPKYSGAEETFPTYAQTRGPQVLGASSLSNTQLVVKRAGPPPYGQRSGWRPRAPEDFGDGGAFPEVPVAQYPLDMGRKPAPAPGNTLAIQVDAEGKIKYDAIARQGHSDKRIIHASFKDLIPLRQRADVGEISLARPSDEEVARQKAKTQAALAALVSGAAAAQKPKNVPGGGGARKEPTYVRYTPANQMGHDYSQEGGGGGGGGRKNDRIIKIVERAQDPMEPPRFRHKKIPRGPPSPPPPVMHSPPRKLTAEDQEAWRIPPPVSNWKNPKGYTVPLDKRLAADGRGLQDVTINDRFAQFSEALYTADRHAREEVKQRALMQQKLAEKEKAQKEEHLRQLAQKAREERAAAISGASAGGGGRRKPSRASPSHSRSRSRSRSASTASSASASSRRRRRSSHHDRRRRRSDTPSGSETGSDGGEGGAKGGEDGAAARERMELRRERRREAERQLRQSRMGAERRLQVLAREQNRDISEKIALGLAKPTQSRETMWDSRLFNRTSGFAAGDGFNEDQPYDKPLFAAQDAISSIYRPRAAGGLDDEELGEEEKGSELERIKKANRFDVLGRAKEGFKGASDAGPRDGPVQFVKDSDTAVASAPGGGGGGAGATNGDPFKEVDDFLSKVVEQSSGSGDGGGGGGNGSRGDKKGKYGLQESRGDNSGGGGGGSGGGGRRHRDGGGGGNGRDGSASPSAASSSRAKKRARMDDD